MIKKPRWYQKEALVFLWQYLNKERGNPLIAMPTGTGKSLVIAEFIRGVLSVDPSKRFLVCTHKEELIVQDYKELLEMWPNAPVGIYSAGLRRKDLVQPIIFGGIDSLVNVKDVHHTDYLIIDEAHLADHRANARYMKLIDRLITVNRNMRVIGLTATPYRLGLGLLTNGTIFDDIAYNLCSMEKFNRLLDEGYLSPLVPREPDEVLDVSNVHLLGGEYKVRELQEAVDVMTKNDAIVQETIELARNRNSWLVYCAGKAHTEKIYSLLNDAYGIPSTFIHSGLKSEDRHRRLEGFRKGEYRAMVNSDILTTGFDHPPLDCIVCLRPTQSVGLWVQMLGRGTRVAKGKTDCLVLDFAGNTKRLGPINDPIPPRRRGEKPGGNPPVRVCPGCRVYVHASYRACPHCGYQFPENDKLNYYAAQDNLIATNEEILINDYDVTSMFCKLHHKPGKPDIFRIEYRCGLRTFRQYLCFEHQGYAAVSAARKWIQLGGKDPAPWTVEEALLRGGELRIPHSITVSETRKGYPEITAIHIDDGDQRVPVMLNKKGEQIELSGIMHEVS